MPPRLQHRKSRNGCKWCKVRKVKCDEARPSCSACLRHDVECVYPHASGRPLNNNHVPFEHQTLGVERGPSRSTGESEDGASPGDVRGSESLLELRLMHKYMQYFPDIFVGMHNSQVAVVWRDMAPELAMEYPFLLHAMFAVTAHYILVAAPGSQRRDGSGERSPTASNAWPGKLDLSDVRRAHREYFNRAVRGQRHAVANLNRENADAVCMGTILIANQGVLLDYDLETDNDHYMPPTQWLLLASSVAEIIKSCWGLLEPDSASKTIITSAESLHVGLWNKNENSTYFAPLMDYQSQLEAEENMTACQVAVNVLGTIRNSIVSGEPVSNLSRRFFIFAALTPMRFTQLVNQLHQRALAILVYFFAMMREVESMWWFKGAAERHVRGLRGFINPDWHWTLEWAEGLINAPTVTQRQLLMQRPTMSSIIPG